METIKILAVFAFTAVMIHSSTLISLPKGKKSGHAASSANHLTETEPAVAEAS